MYSPTLYKRWELRRKNRLELRHSLCSRERMIRRRPTLAYSGSVVNIYRDRVARIKCLCTDQEELALCSYSR